MSKCASSIVDNGCRYATRDGYTIYRVYDACSDSLPDGVRESISDFVRRESKPEPTPGILWAEKIIQYWPTLGDMALVPESFLIERGLRFLRDVKADRELVARALTAEKRADDKCRAVYTAFSGRTLPDPA